MNKSILLALPCIFYLTNALAVDSVGIELGRGVSETNLGQVHLSWSWHEPHLHRWLAAKGWHPIVRLEASLGTWRSNESGARSVWDLGLTPVFRYQSTEANGYYGEGAIGGHLFSNLHVNDSHRFSTSFNFGDFLGFGKRLGEHDQYEVGYRYIHYSNANIKLPNPGMNVHQLHLAYHF